jgi:chemotaxis protein histidine kinase CheA
MALDRNAFISNYLAELDEQLASIDADILTLKQDPGREESLASLLRSLHTIKGSSRMLKFGVMESVAHGLENVFKGVKEGRYEISRDLVRLVFLSTDGMRRNAQSIQASSTEEFDPAPFLAVFEQVYAAEPYSLESLGATVMAPVAARESVPESFAPVPGQDGVPTVAVPTGATGAARATGATGATDAAAADSGPSKLPERRAVQERSRENIRIDLARIDAIVKILNNLIIKQFQFRKEKDLVARLEEAVTTVSSSQISQKDANADLGRLVKELRKKLDEDLELMERNTFELQEEILSLRMLPLELIMGNLGKMVEETAMILGKEINLKMTGTDLLLDKFILEGLHDPIVHIVRNAIDHGIESPAERLAQGKDPVGHLQLSCAAESGHIVIRIKEDGKGLDYAKVRLRAKELFPAQAGDIDTMEESALNSYLFMSGFSTKDAISDLSGRGVGLDIVRHNIEKIKGKITLTSIRGEGTEFVLALPLSLATVDGFFVGSAAEKFLIPANFVKEVIIVKAGDVMDLLNRRAFVLRNIVVPMYPLSVLLGKDDDDPFDRQKFYIVVVEAFGEIMGIMVDSIIQYTTLIYKPVPANLAGIKAIQGIVFDENFDIINILYVPELMNKCKRIRSIDTRRRYSAARRETKRILVVDDSHTTREIEKSILELEHYQVATAVDGIDGLEKLREQQYHLILTDVHMPRMDGLTFVGNLRNIAAYHDIPVVVVSSDEDPQLRRTFMSIGATSFIVKSEFERENLVETVKSLIG